MIDHRCCPGETSSNHPWPWRPPLVRHGEQVPPRCASPSIGAGAFGGWTALHLRRRGADVTLVDAWGPGNTRASSGGETRVIRTIYGATRRYVEMAARALTPLDRVGLLGGRAVLQAHRCPLVDRPRRQLRARVGALSARPRPGGTEEFDAAGRRATMAAGQLRGHRQGLLRTRGRLSAGAARV